jgi:NAD(P)-dependent dehydrogenase (short-subunit alcohol dehydrogenase family)
MKRFSLLLRPGATRGETPGVRSPSPPVPSRSFVRCVLFLGSPANSCVTGQSLMVDGGLTRSY